MPVYDTCTACGQSPRGDAPFTDGLCPACVEEKETVLNLAYASALEEIRDRCIYNGELDLTGRPLFNDHEKAAFDAAISLLRRGL